MKPTKASNRIVLAYSGRVNTTVAIPWLAERYDAEVVTVTLDLHQWTALEATRDSEVIECRSPFALSAVDPRPTTDVVAVRS